eukprot:1334080-Amorphochlora_amoeboformis.AAC.2
MLASSVILGVRSLRPSCRYLSNAFFRGTSSACPSCFRLQLTCYSLRTRQRPTFAKKVSGSFSRDSGHGQTADAVKCLLMCAAGGSWAACGASSRSSRLRFRIWAIQSRRGRWSSGPKVGVDFVG